jgi:hypothetical protein
MVLKTLSPRLSTFDARRVKPPPKQVDGHYTTPEHRAWAREVVRRAGGQCQWPGCTKALPQHRMVADHIVEVKDGGALLDPVNGQCLCVQHNTLKGVKARARRAQGR